jgi:hypothetical protein
MTLPTSPNAPSNTRCAHKRTQLIAKDNDAHYVECLDCGELFEVGELSSAAQPDEKQKSAPESTAGESLSDA